MRIELVTHARHLEIEAIASRAGANSVAIERDMFHPEDARALHAAEIAVRVTIPQPAVIAKRRRLGLDLEAKLAPALAEGLIDIVAGDDVTFLRGWVERHVAAPAPRPW